MLKSSVFAASIALALSAGIASAADLGYPRQVVIPTSIPEYIWTGGFIGLQAGYGWVNSDQDRYYRDFYDFFNRRDLLPDSNSNGFLGGIHAGYNWQYGNLVIGGDASISWIDWGNDKRRSIIVAANEFFPGSPAGKFDLPGRTISGNWIGDIRARLGFAVDRAHFYAAAGVAFTDAQVTHRFYDAGGVFREFDDGNDTNVGWTAGLGMEYAATPNWIVGLEWKYFSFSGDNNKNNIILFTQSLPLSKYSLDNDITANVVQLRASYKF